MVSANPSEASEGLRQEQAAMPLPCAVFSCPLALNRAGAAAEPRQLDIPWGAETSTGEGQEHPGGFGALRRLNPKKQHPTCGNSRVATYFLL